MGRTDTNTLGIASLAFVGGLVIGSSFAASGRASLHPRFGLVAHPGWRIVDQEAETTFESSKSLHDNFTFVERQLRSYGWKRVEIDEDDDEVEARYARGDRTLTLELAREGEDLFELEIEVEVRERDSSERPS